MNESRETHADSEVCHGQVRDEYRMDVDWGRGGFGHIKRHALAERQAALLHQHRMYGEGQDAEAGSAAAAAPLEKEAAAGGKREQDNTSEDEHMRVKRRRRESDSDSDG